MGYCELSERQGRPSLGFQGAWRFKEAVATSRNHWPRASFASVSTALRAAGVPIHSSNLQRSAQA